MDSLLLLLPDFSLILLGALLRRHLVTQEAFWGGVERLVYFVLFPALLFKALAGLSLSWQAALPLFLAALGVMVAGFGLGFIARRFAGLDAMGFASRLQCAYRFNTYIGMAIAGKLHDTAGMALMGGVCGAMVPFANLMAVGSLVRHRQGGLVKELLRNPLVIATLSGLLYNLAGFGLAPPVEAFLARLGDAAIALGLLAVGAALRWGDVGGRWAGSAWLVSVKLLLLPVVAWGLGRLAGLDGTAFDILVLFAALPSASSAYILAMRLGGDGPGVAWMISATTLLAVPSLALWLGVLARFAP